MQGRRPGHSRSEAQPAGGGHDTVYPKYLSLLFLSISDCNTSLPDIFMLCIVHDLCMPSYHSCCYCSRTPDVFVGPMHMRSFTARLAAHSICSDAAHSFARVTRRFYTSDYNVRIDFQIRIFRDFVICKRMTP